MCTRLQFVEEQLALYGGQAEEAWKLDHEQAMRCRQVEDAIRFGLFLLDSMRRHNTEWAKEIGQAKISFEWDQAKCFAKCYSSWLVAARATLKAVEECEGLGFHVEGAENLRAACSEITMLPLDIERVQQSIESARLGNVIPASQAMNELRNRLHA